MRIQGAGSTKSRELATQDSKRVDRSGLEVGHFGEVITQLIPSALDLVKASRAPTGAESTTDNLARPPVFLDFARERSGASAKCHALGRVE